MENCRTCDYSLTWEAVVSRGQLSQTLLTRSGHVIAATSRQNISCTDVDVLRPRLTQYGSISTHTDIYPWLSGVMGFHRRLSVCASVRPSVCLFLHVISKTAAARGSPNLTYTVSGKRFHYIFASIFTKYWTIFKIFSPTDLTPWSTGIKLVFSRPLVTRRLMPSVTVWTMVVQSIDFLLCTMQQWLFSDAFEG